MIGAVIAKRLAGSGFDALNRHDLIKCMASWAEDGTFTFPGNSSMSGETKGKKAIEAWFAKMMEQFPKIDFTVKEVFVSNICRRRTQPSSSPSRNGDKRLIFGRGSGNQGKGPYFPSREVP